MLALDPPNPGGSATVGGVVACGDSGPLRHRYGAARDLLLGMRAALPTGRWRGRAAASSRTWPATTWPSSSPARSARWAWSSRSRCACTRPAGPADDRRGAGTDPETLGRAVSDLAGASLELECLDVRWGDGRGAVLARVAGQATEERAARCAAAMAAFGLDVRIEEDDDALWTGQRSAQRSAEGTVVRVSSVRSELRDRVSRGGASRRVGRRARRPRTVVADAAAGPLRPTSRPR